LTQPTCRSILNSPSHDHYRYFDPSRTRQILFPTDFSETSRYAFEYALDMAAHIGARVLMFHSYDEAPTAAGVAPPDFLNKLRAEKEEKALAGFRAYEAEAEAHT
jgi:nucleotide-binding universal stress UspA family protein